MIWIIGGTSEARKLVNNISDLNNYIVTVATVSGQEFLNPHNLKVGRMTYKEMGAFIEKNAIKAIIDLTHPYAKIVSDNAKKIAKEKSIDYIRYVREKMDCPKGIVLESYREAYDYLKKIKGRVFFTTGSKNIEDFQKVRGDNKFIYRVLPSEESIRICKDHKVHIRDIVAVLGPFSKEYNKAMFKEYKADYVIMKDSGIAGGTLEKLKACEELGIMPIIIAREDEEGIVTLEELETLIRNKY